jgi:hypothetical protein
MNRWRSVSRVIRRNRKSTSWLGSSPTRVAFSLSVTDRELFLSIGDDNLTGAVVRLSRRG